MIDVWEYILHCSIPMISLRSQSVKNVWFLSETVSLDFFLIGRDEPSHNKCEFTDRYFPAKMVSFIFFMIYILSFLSTPYFLSKMTSFVKLSCCLSVLKSLDLSLYCHFVDPFLVIAKSPG